MTPKVLLISLLQKSHRNLSILTLYSFLKHNFIDTKVIFLPKYDSYEHKLLNDFIRMNGFNIIGISVLTEYFHFASRITLDIKTICPECKIVWGGIHPTIMPHESLLYADAICRGEGEEAFLNLIKKMLNNDDYSTIPGIGVKMPDQGYKINDPGPLVSDLDSLPFVQYDFQNYYIQDEIGLRNFDKKEYVRYSSYKGEDYTLMTSRSCPFSCSYCCNSFLNMLYGRRTIRKRSVENVLSEINHAIKAIGSIKFINFIDDFFLWTPEWTDEFSIRYQEEINLPFKICLVPGTFNDDTIKKLSAAGLKFVQIGIQSGSKKTNREIYKRKFSKERIIESSHILHRHGIYPYYDVIIQNDLETSRDKSNTIRLLLELKKPFGLNLFGLTPFPGTQLEKIYEEKKITPPNNSYEIEKSTEVCDENDFYYQLCSIIPYTDNAIVEKYLINAKSISSKSSLNQYYNETKEIRMRRPVAQDHP